MIPVIVSSENIESLFFGITLWKDKFFQAVAFITGLKPTGQPDVAFIEMRVPLPEFPVLPQKQQKDQEVF